MREPLGKRLIAAMEEVLADVKKAKEGMQESGDDKFVNEMSEEDITLINELPTKVDPYDDLFRRVGVREKY